VITDSIPTCAEPTTHRGPSHSTSAPTAASPAGAGNVHVGNGKFALTVGGAANRAGDYDTPLGQVDNSQATHGAGPGRRVVDRREGVPRRQLRLRRIELRRADRQGRHECTSRPSGTRSASRPAARILAVAAVVSRDTLGVRAYQHTDCRQ
jgi:hypothetical protein